MRAAIAIGFVICVGAIATAWQLRPVDPPYTYNLPPGFPLPSVPADNPVTRAGAELGRHLFYDPRLSANGRVSCATCHQQPFAFADPRAKSVGATGELTPRHAMSLANVAYATSLNWADPNTVTLEHQMLTPLFGEEPIEMGLTGHEQRVLAELNADPVYAELLEHYRNRSSRALTWQDIPVAIADFLRTLVSANAPYDRYLLGEVDALSASAQRGLGLFVSETLECFHCHGGFNFSDASTHDPANQAPRLFHNTGLYNLNGNGAYPPGNEGLYRTTSLAADMGRFRAPTLRNISRSAPYMHDGSVATLDAVLDHYQSGGTNRTSEPFSGDGTNNPYKSEFINGFELSDSERRDVIAFLDALTDERFLSNPEFANPWAQP